MAEVTYGFVNTDNILVGHAVVNDNDLSILNTLIPFFNAESAYRMDLTQEVAAVHSTFWNGTRFIHASPHPSWVWNEEENRWKPPFDGPSDDKYYEWDESIVNWVEATPIDTKEQ